MTLDEKTEQEGELKRLESFHDPTTNVLRDPFLLTKANDTVFFGPSHTLSAPSTSFGVYMSLISTKPRKNVMETQTSMEVQDEIPRSKLGEEVLHISVESTFKKFLEFDY